MSSEFNPSQLYCSTVLIYDLGIAEEELFSAAVDDLNKEVNGKITIHKAAAYSDIMCVPYFMAAINFEMIPALLIEEILDFFYECEAPIPDSLLELGFKEADFVNPDVYVYQYNHNGGTVPQSFVFNENLFDDPKYIKSAILTSFRKFNDSSQ